MINSTQDKIEFDSLISKISSRPGVNELINWLNKTDFFTAPASTKYHNACTGGLLNHSLSVAKCALKLFEDYKELITDTDPSVTEESIILTALFHDLCKVNVYSTEQRNRKNAEGQWEQYDVYKFTENFPLPHASKSLYMLNNFVKLNAAEIMAVAHHMGYSDPSNTAVNGYNNMAINDAFAKFPLSVLIHMADVMSCFIIETRH